MITTSEPEDGRSDSFALSDSTLAEQLARDGFIHVPFLSSTEVARLRSLWDHLGCDDFSGIYSNVHALDPAINRHVDEVITDVFTPAFERLFLGARLAGASFLAKGVGPNSASTPHQDWNNVDEAHSLSLSIWVPLVDVDENNGALQVIPGTHRLRRSVRSLDTPSLYLDFTDELDPLLRAVPAGSGDAVIYAHNLFHGSKPNKTSQPRVCAVSGVVGSDTPLIHHRRVTSVPDTFDVFEVDRDFYFSGIQSMQAGQVPDTARWVDRVVVPDSRLEIDDIMEFVAHASRQERPRAATKATRR